MPKDRSRARIGDFTDIEVPPPEPAEHLQQILECLLRIEKMVTLFYRLLAIQIGAAVFFGRSGTDDVAQGAELK